MLPCEQPDVIAYSNYLISSFNHWTGMHLASSPEALYHAPFVVVSHGTQDDPVFCYANETAQKLWHMDWNTFTHLSSRLSAEPDAQQDRQRILERAQRNGYVDDYKGVRITSQGKRFRIQNCILWNVLDDEGLKIGQAATFSEWSWLQGCAP